MISPHTPKTVDAYISGLPPEIQALLQQVREAIHTAAPAAVEVISYRMPAVRMNGILVYFAGYKNHIGFYPTASGMAAFKKELTSYKTGRGSVQFPVDEPLPVELIEQIVRYRVEEDRMKQDMKRRKSQAEKS
jgi:uncharacterized protein YdhG (YjbR/CyaY superfamily)